MYRHSWVCRSFFLSKNTFLMNLKESLTNLLAWAPSSPTNPPFFTTLRSHSADTRFHAVTASFLSGLRSSIPVTLPPCRRSLCTYGALSALRTEWNLRVLLLPCHVSTRGKTKCSCGQYMQTCAYSVSEKKWYVHIQNMILPPYSGNIGQKKGQLSKVWAKKNLLFENTLFSTCIYLLNQRFIENVGIEMIRMMKTNNSYLMKNNRKQLG